METSNTASTSAPHKRLFDFVKHNRLNPAAILESRRKDVEALASVNLTLLSGLQSLVRLQAEYLCGTAADLQSLGSSKQGDDAKAAPVRVTELLPLSLNKAVAGLRGMSDTVYKAQADSFAVVGKRLAENVEEVKSVLRPRQ
ncbi:MULTISPECIES: phasin family protein [unclassified Cupriavidus]|uniref:phasin family protein n=1 Tax=unclassified Cupriavidus TaxID=2640874 RepID=UPI0028BA9585|nr:phasin family protein [Cupriavidus sp. SZY C1]MDT6961776.1 phasin family protein [Cupriavidus sp. SZY C1]